ncbi:MAG: hypothetical protein ACFFFB_09765 [Candidatus Heimdallarchaeota archaeon]
MENTDNLKVIAQKNLDIAENERLICKTSKLKVKQDLKSAKVRESLVKNEMELAKLKLILADKNKELIERKGEVKDILNFSNNNLKSEEEYAIYNGKIAVIKRSIAEVQKKISHLDREIAEEELKIINEKLRVAKERELLAKMQFSYIELIQKSAPSEKLTKIKEDTINQQEELYEAIKDVYKKSVEIGIKEDELADLKKLLSEKLSEREKIRPPRVKFPTNV